MTDEPSATAADQTQTQTTTPPLPNDPAARTADGTLKDAQAPASTTTEPKAEPKPDAKPTVPEKYDFKPPEGQKLDDALVEKATPIFKELGLTQDAAQKLFDFYNTHAKTSAEAATKLVNDMRSEWRDKITNDPNIGPKLGTEKDPGPLMVAIGKAKDSIFEGDPKGLAAFNEAMNLTGAGDHPDIFKAWIKIAERVSEGTHVSGKGPSEQGQAVPNKAGRPSAAQAMYPNLPSATTQH